MIDFYSCYIIRNMLTFGCCCIIFLQMQIFATHPNELNTHSYKKASARKCIEIMNKNY